MKLDAIVVEPLGYFNMLSALTVCTMVMTDSGGLQKESYFCNKFCVTLRDQTEWTELVDAGANVLAGATKEKIIDSVLSNLGTKVQFDVALYGDGNASARIVNRLTRKSI